MPQSNELRVFISSTFRDLQEEREHLVKKIFPEIRALCRQRGIRFTEVDLRWGLTDEHVALGQVIRTCLEEVDKCRPYFIGITGDRYGFVPTYLDIQKDPALLEQYPWIEDAAIDGMSITEMEAHYAVLNTALPSPSSMPPIPHNRARFYFRRHRATLDDSSEDNEERAGLEAYQQRIRQANANVEHFRDPISLGELIYDDLIEIIKTDFADARPPTPLEEERMRHEAFALSRRRAYIANPSYLKRLNDHVASDDPPLVVYAESGSGKSSLFAFWADQYRRKNPDAHVIEHYVGIGATATDHYAIIQHLCMEIKDRFSRDEEIPTAPEELEKAFGQWLGYASHELKSTGGRMVLMLDGLNQLQGAALNLRWIPEVIAPSIRLILSSTVEGTLVELKRRGWKEFGMQALTEAEREAVTVRYLAEYHKSLNAEQINRIAGDYKCGHPLFLKTLLEELRLVGRHEELDERISEYLEATGTEDLFQKMLERIEDDHGARAVRQTLSLLWASRSGLDERELSEVSGLARLKIATMTVGLDYHLVRKEGRLTFFHDYLRRAIEKRYLADEQSKRRAHHQLAEFFEQSELDQRNARERMWGYSQAGDEAKLVETLANLEVLQLLYSNTGANEVLTHWARLREAGHDVEASYARSIEQSSGRESSELLKSWSMAANLLERLGLWSGAIAIERRILEEAIRSGLETEIASAERALGWSLQLRGDYDEARTLLEHALQMYEKIDDRRGIASAAYAVGAIHSRQCEYDRAQEYVVRSLKIREELGDQRSISASLSALAALCYERGEYDRALEFLQRELSIAEKLGDLADIAEVYGRMGTIYADRDDHDRALQATGRWLTIAEELGDLQSVAIASGNMGLIYIKLMELDRAMECFKRKLTIAEQMGDRRGVSEANNYMGNLHSSRDENERALECYERSRAIGEELGHRKSSGIAVGNMGNVYADVEEYRRALDCLAEATKAHRTVNYPYGLTYWLAGTARVLLELVEKAEETSPPGRPRADARSMPDYLARHLPDATESDWQRVALRVARERAEECRTISTELQKPDTLFSSTVHLARLDAAEEHPEAARVRLLELLDSTTDDARRANCHYWLWKLEFDPDSHHRTEAARIYRTLMQNNPYPDYTGRLEELQPSEDAS